ncbi:astacin-like metalloendopeptidase [Tachyglossus aculeatus]|uniref:astacin-like metalloendopeptidase n=1 Tax=Tachyglossus aculeatus TaxID=9261 RepID=UPI0018F77C8C|nr:astacin-like metalloendopeptidase [Tachyglossus aculeatus]
MGGVSCFGLLVLGLLQFLGAGVVLAELLTVTPTREDATGLLGDPTVTGTLDPRDWDIPAINHVFNPEETPEGGFLIEGDIIKTSPFRMYSAFSSKWPVKDGMVQIPYRLSSKYDQSQRAVILEAFTDFEQLTCVRFVSHTNENDFVSITPLAGCFSSVGRSGGMQVVSLAPLCLQRGKGIVLHELMHVMGFWHEHSRADRDRYIDISWREIMPGFEINFVKSQSSNMVVAYDYSSVMHYGRFAFSARGLPTITPLAGSEVSIGQRRYLSSSDIARINQLYSCSRTGLEVAGNQHNGIRRPRGPRAMDAALREMGRAPAEPTTMGAAADNRLSPSGPGAESVADRTGEGPREEGSTRLPALESSVAEAVASHPVAPGSSPAAASPINFSSEQALGLLPLGTKGVETGQSWTSAPGVGTLRKDENRRPSLSHPSPTETTSQRVSPLSTLEEDQDGLLVASLTLPEGAEAVYTVTPSLSPEGTGSGGPHTPAGGAQARPRAWGETQGPPHPISPRWETQVNLGTAATPLTSGPKLPLRGLGVVLGPLQPKAPGSEDSPPPHPAAPVLLPGPLSGVPALAETESSCSGMPPVAGTLGPDSLGGVGPTGSQGMEMGGRLWAFLWGREAPSKARVSETPAPQTEAVQSSGLVPVGPSTLWPKASSRQKEESIIQLASGATSALSRVAAGGATSPFRETWATPSGLSTAAAGSPALLPAPQARDVSRFGPGPGQTAPPALEGRGLRAVSSWLARALAPPVARESQAEPVPSSGITVSSLDPRLPFPVASPSVGVGKPRTSGGPAKLKVERGRAEVKHLPQAPAASGQELRLFLGPRTQRQGRPAAATPSEAPARGSRLPHPIGPAPEGDSSQFGGGGRGPAPQLLHAGASPPLGAVPPARGGGLLGPSAAKAQDTEQGAGGTPGFWEKGLTSPLTPGIPPAPCATNPPTLFPYSPTPSILPETLPLTMAAESAQVASASTGVSGQSQQPAVVLPLFRGGEAPPGPGPQGWRTALPRGAGVSRRALRGSLAEQQRALEAAEPRTFWVSSTQPGRRSNPLQIEARLRNAVDAPKPPLGAPWQCPPATGCLNTPLHGQAGHPTSTETVAAGPPGQMSLSQLPPRSERPKPLGVSPTASLCPARLCPPLLGSPPRGDWFCDFEIDLCGWLQSGAADSNWTRTRHGPGLAREDGLSVAAPCTFPTGHHLSLRNPAPERRAVRHAALVSPLLSGAKWIRFWHGPLCPDVGTINLYLRFKSLPGWHPLWTSAGCGSLSWNWVEVELLASRKIQVMVEGVLGPEEGASLAIDNLSICGYH